jgi:N-acetylglutamate synthase-like GNAT family acetyltransferase
MNAYRARRATTDDLEQMVKLWEGAHLAPVELEKRFTEFQVAEDGQGRLVGAIALHIAGSEGRIHSETFPDFSLTDEVRPKLWERLQVLAANHGLFRLWTQETAPFWKKAAGFNEPSAETLGKLPEAFRSETAGWLALQLKEAGADPDRLEKEFAAYREAEKAKREKMMQQATALRVVGTIIAVIIFLFAISILIYYFRPHSRR